MSKQFRVEWHNDGWVDIEGAELPELRALMVQIMRGMRVSSFVSLSPIVKLLLRFASSDAVIFHTGKFSPAARDRPQLLEWKIESDIAVKFAIRRIARITFLRTPNLAAGIAIARERSRTGRRVTGRINRALRCRSSKQQSVRVKNKPADIRFLQNRIESGRVGAFGQPKTVWLGMKDIDMNVTTDENLRAGGFARLLDNQAPP